MIDSSSDEEEILPVVEKKQNPEVTAELTAEVTAEVTAELTAEPMTPIGLEEFSFFECVNVSSIFSVSDELYESVCEMNWQEESLEKSSEMIWKMDSGKIMPTAIKNKLEKVTVRLPYETHVDLKKTGVLEEVKEFLQEQGFEVNFRPKFKPRITLESLIQALFLRKVKSLRQRRRLKPLFR